MIDLERRRDVGAIIGDALRLFFAYAPVFFTATLIVVAPFEIVVNGILGHQFADGINASPPVGVSLLSSALSAFVIPAFVTSLHVRAVQGLADGVVPSVGGVLHQAVRLVPVVLPVIVLYAVGVVVGLVLFVVPGIYLGTRWYFNAQAVVVDGHRGSDALHASGELVAGSWWRVFGTVLLLGIVAAAIGYGVGGLLGLLVRIVTDSGAVYVIISTFGQTIALSIGALGGTLLFFDLRREKGIVEDPMRGYLPPTTDAFGR